jgi:hypothetical protein
VWYIPKLTFQGSIADAVLMIPEKPDDQTGSLICGTESSDHHTTTCLLFANAPTTSRISAFSFCFRLRAKRKPHGGGANISFFIVSHVWRIGVGLMPSSRHHG